MNHAEPATADTRPTSEALQLEIVSSLSILLDLVPKVSALTDSHQRGLGFMSYDARQIENAMIRKERRERIKAQILGQPAGHGATAAPGNFTALSVYVEIWAAARHQVRRLVRWQAKNGVVPAVAPAVEVPVDGATAIELLRMLRPLVWETTEDRVLRAVLDDLQHVHELAEHLIDGNDRTLLDVPCPHCGRKTLVATFKDGVITCGKDHATGERHACICSDPLCECKTRPVAYRHTWHRNHVGRADSWEALADRRSISDLATKKGPTT